MMKMGETRVIDRSKGLSLLFSGQLFRRHLAKNGQTQLKTCQDYQPSTSDFGELPGQPCETRWIARAIRSAAIQSAELGAG
jgi:hypothetical protein